MEEFEITDALIAIGFGVFVLLVIVPIIGVLLLTLFDAMFRQDIGLSRFIWLSMVLFVPVGGLLMYWLLRPKDFNPLVEAREAETYRFPASYAARNGRAMPATAAAPTPLHAPAAVSAPEPPEQKAA